MDIATKLFSLSLGVEPNKATLKELSDTLNSAVLTLAEKQKALERYAETAQSQSYTVQASPPKRETPKQTPPVVWQISQAKLKELQWKRAQLRQFERERAARNKTTPAKRSTPKSAPDKGFRKSFQAKESTVERGEGIDSQKNSQAVANKPVARKAKKLPSSAQKSPPQPEVGESKAQTAKKPEARS